MHGHGNEKPGAQDRHRQREGGVRRPQKILEEDRDGIEVLTQGGAVKHLVQG
jgi:DNA-binding FrmR family transcriptional regulator